MKKIRKKYKLKYQNILVILLIVYIVCFLIMNLINQKITNIYILNNSYLSDQKIIELALIKDYPSTLTNTCNRIKKRLEDNLYINKASVYKKNFTEVYIDVVENRPIFYKSSTNKTVLLDGMEVDDNLLVPVLINYIPDTLYNSFLLKMGKIDKDVLLRISEIEYNPNEVDSQRFLLTMNDNNYVYLTMYKFESINSYIDIIKKFEGKKGILYLDSGEYFKVIE
ncbi:MAG: FtsQ-type POTRA domain-containing protein [Bacilli bacterium]